MDRVTNISWRTTSGASLGGFAYEYDALGRITSRSFTLFAENAATNTFTHNALNQITTSLRASAPPREIFHDLDGNLTNDRVFTYSYDAANLPAFL